MEEFSVQGLTLVLRETGYGGLVEAVHSAVTRAGGGYRSVECTPENARREVGKADLVIFIGQVTDEAVTVLKEIRENTGLPIFFVVDGDPGRRLEGFSGLVIFSAAEEPLETLETRIREELTVGEIWGVIALQSRLPDILVDLTTNEAVILAAQNIPLKHRLWFLADNCLGEPVSWMGKTLRIVADVTVGFDEGKRRIFVVESVDEATPTLPPRPSLLPVEFELMVEPASALANL